MTFGKGPEVFPGDFPQNVNLFLILETLFSEITSVMAFGQGPQEFLGISPKT